VFACRQTLSEQQQTSVRKSSYPKLRCAERQEERSASRDLHSASLVVEQLNPDDDVTQIDDPFHPRWPLYRRDTCRWWEEFIESHFRKLFQGRYPVRIDVMQRYPSLVLACQEVAGEITISVTNSHVRDP